MTQLPMYPAQPDSPDYVLASDITSTSQTALVFASLTGLLAAPNTLTIRQYDSDTTPETVYYATDPVGSTLTVTRGFGGTVAKTFTAGAKACRAHTAYDLNTVESNISDIVSSLPAKATRTIADQSVYVDIDATGAGTGTSWSDAFTSIQTAIESLQTVLENAVTIYVRKGSVSYAETFSFSQNIGKGSLEIRGEYYWDGQCAAAGTPASDKFNVTATDGSAISVGDSVYINHGYSAFLNTSVLAVSNVGGTVWEVQVASSSSWGNISNTDYYVISKTQNTGTVTVNETKCSITGLILARTDTNKSNVTITSCIFTGSVSVFASLKSVVTIQHCICTGNSAVGAVCSELQSSVILGTSNSTPKTCTVYDSGGWTGLNVRSNGFAQLYRTIIDSNAGAAISANTNSVVSGNGGTINNANTGLFARKNSLISWTSVTNNASTPADPATSTDASYIT